MLYYYRLSAEAEEEVVEAAEEDEEAHQEVEEVVEEGEEAIQEEPEPLTLKTPRTTPRQPTSLNMNRWH